MADYADDKELFVVKVPRRHTAILACGSRTTNKRNSAPPWDRDLAVPPNKLSAAEPAEILAVESSPELVDLTPRHGSTSLRKRLRNKPPNSRWHHST